MIKEVKSFGADRLACRQDKGVRLAAHCLHFRKLTSLCIMLDKPSPGAPWVYKGTCRREYGAPIPDSVSYAQKIRFSDYNFTLEVQSYQNPSQLFTRVTGGIGHLDEDPAQQLNLSICLLILALAILGLSLYKACNAVQKYQHRQRGTFKRAKQYEVEIENESDNSMEDDPEATEDSHGTAKHKLTQEEIQQQKFEQELEERSAKEEHKKTYSRVSDTTVDADQVDRNNQHHFERKSQRNRLGA